MSNTTIGNGSGTYDISPSNNSTVTIGNGNDTIVISGGTQDKITIGSGNDSVTVSGATSDNVTIGSGIDTVTLTGGSHNTVTLGSDNDTVNAGTEQYDTINAGNGNDTITAGANNTVNAGGGNDTVNAGSKDTVTLGGGTDKVAINGSNTSVTLGNGNDTVTSSGGSGNTVTVGNGNSIIAVGGDTDDTIVAGNGTNTITTGADSTITTSDGTLTFGLCGIALTIAVGCGSDTITAGVDSIISVGNGNDTITAGAGSTITAGNGTDTINAGAGSTIMAGSATDSLTLGGFTLLALTIADGNDTINAGANSTIVAGDGNDTITAGAGSTITVGTAANTFTFLGCTIDIPGCNGAVTVTAGANSIVTVGNGNATVNMGASNIVTIGTGKDLLTLPTASGVSVTAPTTLTVVEEHAVALAISASASGGGFGAEKITGFSASDELQLSTSQFANYAAVIADARQVGANTVITLDASDTITLANVKLSSLTASNFIFVGGSGPGSNVTVTIAGVPAGTTLTSAADPSGVAYNSATNTWTVATAALSGLTLNAAGATNATLTVTATNTANGATASQNVALTVDQAAPVLGGAKSTTINEDGAVTLGVTDIAAFSDDTLGQVTITGLASDLTGFNGGAYNASAGTWTGTAVQFNALSFTGGEVGTSTLSITATTTGVNPGASTTEAYTLTVDPVAPALTAPAALSVNTDGTVALDIGETPFDPRDPVSITITGVPSDATLSAGINNGGGSWTLTPAQLSGLTLTAGQTTTANLVVTATNTAGATASTSDTIALTVNPVLSIAIDVFGNNAVQQGQILYTQATITGDAADMAEPITYQWQTSSNGGSTWTDVAATTAGTVNNILSSLYQLELGNIGDIFRVQASFTDDAGNIITATSAPTAAVTDITPVLTVPFSYTVDAFDIVKGSNTFSDDFLSPPPAGGLFGTTLDVFSTASGAGGSTFTEGVNNLGQPAAIMASSGTAANGYNVSDQAILVTNTNPEGTGAGESNTGLKENATFTVSGTFDLVAPQPGTGYGIQLENGAPGVTANEVVQLQVIGLNNGGAAVAINQTNYVTETFTQLASFTLSAAQLADNTQIELDLAHNTANSTTVTGSFELYDAGTETFSDTLAATPHIFNGQTYTRAEILAFSNDGVTILGKAQEGQTLTANTVTNDANATISYQWQESTSSSFASFTAIGTNSPTYLVQESDENDYIRVVATATDANTGVTATATSAATGPVIDDGSIAVAIAVNGNGIAQVGQVVVGTATITGDASDLAAPVTYQWQLSSDGGVTWTDVPQTAVDATSSIYQFSESNIGDIFRVQASFTNDTGQVVTATSAATVPVQPAAPILSVPFSYAVDEFKVVKGNGLVLDDTFANGPPPVAGTFVGGTADAFSTGGGGSTWTVSDGKAIMASTGASFNGIDDSIQGFLFSNQQPEGTGPGENDTGYKEDGTFTVSGTFDLTAPLSGTSYGLVMGNFSPIRANETEVVQLLVQGLANGSVSINVNQINYAASTFNTIASYTLSAAQLADNTQIELDLAHATPNVPTVTATFELIDNGAQTFADTLSTSAHVFQNQTWTTVGMEAISTSYITILGTAQIGDTLTASTSTNDPEATINYQWQESSDGVTWTDIGTNSVTYAVQGSDLNDQIRVTATTSDPNNPQSATATSAPTAPVAPGVSIAIDVFGNNAIQQGQILYTQATITGDAADEAAPIAYQWQESSDGGQTWTDIPATTMGTVNSILSSLYQLELGDVGDLVRVQASFTDDQGQVITSTSAPTTPVADITPVLTVPFSYAVDSFDIVKGATTFTDNFSSPPPAGGLFGTTLDVFSTVGGAGGGTLTEGVNNLGQPAAILSSGGAAANGYNVSDQAILVTNTNPEGTGAGQSNSGLKENSTFTVSGTFDLVAPQSGTGYGIQLENGTPGVTANEVVQLQVVGLSNGGAAVAIFQTTYVTDTFTELASFTLSAAQLADNTQIELNLAHNTANTTTVTGSFELYDNGTETFSDTLAATPHAFNNQTFTRAEILSFSNVGVMILGAAQEGQTLTANTATNDANATISYQWEESTSSSFASFTDIGGNSATYAVQAGDINDYIRVVATATDANSGATTTVTSASTGPVTVNVGLSVSTSIIGNAGSPMQVGQELVTSATITGDAADLAAPITYQWQSSSDGGVTWTDVPATTAFNYNSQLSSVYQLGEADEGNIIRVQASFIDDAGQTITATSTPTVPVADATPILSVPFSYTVDEFKYTNGLGADFDDTFSNGPPPVGAVGMAGMPPIGFQTSAGGYGSTWIEGVNNLGQPAAIMTATGAGYNTVDNSVNALLLTSPQPEGTGAGENNSGLKENDTFTIIGTFDLVAPVPGTSYGIAVVNTVNPGTEEVQLQVDADSSGGAVVVLDQNDPQGGIYTQLASFDLSAAQMTGNTQIEFDIAHNTINSTNVTGSFELYDNGVQTFADTFTPVTPGHVFDNSTAARGEIQGIDDPGNNVNIPAVAQEGQTLTASTSTNDPDATINYQWQESNNGSTWTDIGTNNASYTVQASDVGSSIRVTATTSDPDNPLSATATSAATAPITAMVVGIPDGASVDIPTASGAIVTFTGSTGSLELDQSQSFTGTVSGFSGNDQIDLRDIGFGATSTLGYAPNSDNSGGVLTVSDGTHTANIALLGQYTAGSFATASDSFGGTMITDPPVAAQSQITQPHA